MTGIRVRFRGPQKRRLSMSKPRRSLLFSLFSQLLLLSVWLGWLNIEQHGGESFAAWPSEASEAPPPPRYGHAYVTPWKPSGTDTWLFTSKRRIRYHTIADFAPSTALLMSHSASWEPILEDIIREIDVPVYLTSEDRDEEAALQAALNRWSGQAKQNVHSLTYDVDSAWVRDYGPIQQVSTAKSRHVRWVDGGYHPDRKLDDELPFYLSRRARVPTKRLSFKMEGGALVSNGDGLCASTEEYMVTAGLYQSLLEPRKRDRLLSDLGCRTLVLVPALPKEETEHIDLFLQFVARDRVIVADANQDKWPRLNNLLRVSKQRLIAAAKVHGIYLDLVPVTIPKIDEEVYYTYINGIRVNNRFLVPSFSEVSSVVEQQAYEQLSRAMPKVEIVPIDVRDLPQHLGLLHCVVLGLSLPPKALLRLQKQPPRRTHRRRRPIRS